MSMNSINIVILAGNLGKDPEFFQPEGKKSVCVMSIATNNIWYDSNGERQSRTDWHKIITWGRIAEICASHLCKGSWVHIQGRISTNTWITNEGKKISEKEIVAERVVFDRVSNAPVEDSEYFEVPSIEENNNVYRHVIR